MRHCGKCSSYCKKSAARVEYNTDMEELLDGFHLLQRIGRACVSDAHAAYPKFENEALYTFFHENGIKQ